VGYVKGGPELDDGVVGVGLPEKDLMPCWATLLFGPMGEEARAFLVSPN